MAYFRKRPNGWEYRISYKDVTGKYRQKSKSGFSTKALAQAAARQVEIELEKGVNVNKDITLYDYYTDWVETYKKPSSSTGTLKNYGQTARLVEQFFLTTKLADVTHNLYQKFLNSLKEKYTKATIHKHHHRIRLSIKHAVADGLIPRNFTDMAIISSEKEGRTLEGKFLQLDEYTELLEELKVDIHRNRHMQMYLLSVTGMRVGESLGLIWSDIDFENGTISINKTWNQYTKDGFAPTKNKNSVRTIPVDDETLELLTEYKETSWKENELDRVFPYNTNNHLNKQIKKMTRQEVHVHSLRHTYASFLISKGIDLLSVSKVLGHKDLTTTLSVYTHQLKEIETKNFNKIKELFGVNLG